MSVSLHPLCRVVAERERVGVLDRYPEPALRLSGTARNAWMDGYLDRPLLIKGDDFTQTDIRIALT